MSLSLKTHFNLARSALKQRRGRTFLTCLGIAIGVGSIILILSLLGSIDHLVSDQLAAIGNDLIVVRPSSEEDNNDDFIGNTLSNLTNSHRYNKSNLAISDANLIRSLNPGYSPDSEYPITGVAPLAISTNTLTTAERTVNSGTVVGTSPELQSIIDLKLSDGTFLADNTLKTAVIGHNLALELFGTTEPIGLTFNLLNEKFIITGILTETNDPINFNNVDFDDAVIIDITQLRSLESNIQIQQINVKVANESVIEPTAERIKSALLEFKSGDTNFVVVYGDDISHPAGNLLTIVSGILTTVASISLIVGGIGVMNIMLVSVSERTHEVGIRKAIGATNLNIFLQFFLESLLLCIIGGIAGLVIGYVLAFLISTITPFTPYCDPYICLTAIGVSILVGTFFGLYPAVKAARKNPIDSLKQYN